jgi:hypothetical protein
MKLLNEQIEDVFKQLFQNENIGPELYRIFVNPTGLQGRYYVVLVWDGFDAMSVTARQKWIWERLRKVAPDVEFRQHLSQVLARSVKEFVVADELAIRSESERIF